MTRDEMERMLAELPFRLLRRLARTVAGPQVLRMGKRRMIHAVMVDAETAPARVEAAIRAWQRNIDKLSTADSDWNATVPVAESLH